MRLGNPGAYRGPFASSDHMLAFLDVPRATEAVMAALGPIPRDEAVLFVGRASAPAFAQTYYGVASAGVPRMVADVRCGDDGEVRGPYLDPGVPYGAVVVFEPLRTIPDPGAVRVGERLVVVRGRPRPDLRPYCSAVLAPPPGVPAPDARPSP